MSSQYPLVYKDYTTPELLAAFNAGPRRLREVTSGLDEARLKARVIPEKWSIFEIILHVADAEIMGAARFRLALSESGVLAPRYDQDAWCREMAYNEAPLAAFAEALDLLESLTRTSNRLFDGLTAEDWEAYGVIHAEWGRMTLRQLLELYADHRERHVAQILERRALLGVPIEYALLLEKRLY